MRTIISTEALANGLGEVVLVDCRYDLQNEMWGRAQYRAAHIPGAVYASLVEDMAGPRTRTSGRHPVPSTEALAATFGRLGISRGTPVVAYDQDSGMYASRLWWSLRYLGHDDVAILDGGWAKWVREGRPTVSGHEHRERAVFEPAPRPGMKVDTSEVEDIVAHGSALLVDARAPERYEGRVEPIDKAAGHIPGAVNRHFRDNLAEDGTMLPPEVLRRAFASVLNGLSPRDAVMYCGSGVTACHNLVALEHAGLTGARLYPGSWSEWSNDPARPIEKTPSSM